MEGRVPIFLCHRNMSLRQLVIMSLCLKTRLLYLRNMSLRQSVIVSFCLNHVSKG